MKLNILLMLLIVSTACNSQVKKVNANKRNDSVSHETATQIAEYVTSVFEDSKRNLWFGTLAKGIAKYDGNELRYYTENDGLPSNRVTSVREDKNGFLWFNTGNGLSRFDGNQFVNFLVKEDDFASNMVSNLLIDSKNNFWLGTWNGVYKFDGENFQPFSIPFPEVDTRINEDTKNWITGIEEDPDGNIWINRDGYGVCKYDGKSFVHLLKKDGLHSNNVTEIVFDKDGNIWVGTRVGEKDNPDPEKRTGKGGVNKVIGNETISFPEIKGFNDDDVYEIYKDRTENIWVSTIRNGVYKFDGKEFIHYDIPISIMGIIEDHKGNLWLGGAGGLYRINQNEEVVNVTTNGPWE